MDWPPNAQGIEELRMPVLASRQGRVGPWLWAGAMALVAPVCMGAYLIATTASQQYVPPGTLTDGEVSWTFAKPISTSSQSGYYQYGEFCCDAGGYWIVGDPGTPADPNVYITAIDPNSCTVPDCSVSHEGSNWTCKTTHYSSSSHTANGTEAAPWTTYWEAGGDANRGAWLAGRAYQADRVVNGSMLNPGNASHQHVSSYHRQGWDTGMISNGTVTLNAFYLESDNVGWDVAHGGTLAVEPNNTLVSCVSYTSADMARTAIKRMAVLTVLGSAPPDNSFRPAYATTLKPLEWTTASIDWDQLKSLTPTADAPALSEANDDFDEPWINGMIYNQSHDTAGWQTAAVFPAESMHYYGRNNHERIGEAALLLNCNYTQAQKQELLYNFLQLGIDLYGIVDAGGTKVWIGDGGFSSGRKWPILFAGIMFADEDMNSIGDKSGQYLYSGAYGPTQEPADYIHFGEDDQTFKVTQDDVDWTTGTSSYPFEGGDIGKYWWGQKHSFQPSSTEDRWQAPYQVTASRVFSGTALAALIMDAKTLWNHDPYFEWTNTYMDHFVGVNESARYLYSTWSRDMWDEYSDDYGY